MKAITVLTTIALMGSTYAVKSQDRVIVDTRDELSIGVVGGANFSNLYDTKGQNFVANSLVGGVFGGFLSIPVGTYLGLQPEVLYSQKGYSGTGTLPDGSPYSYTDRTNYLDVPILIQFKPVENLYLLGGPEYSYLLSRDYTFTNGVTSSTTQQEFQNDNIAHNVFGLMFGIDLVFNHLVIGGRVAWDLQDNNGNGGSTLPRYRNIWEQVTVGIRL